MENVNKYHLPDDNPPPYDVVVGNNQSGLGIQHSMYTTPPQNLNHPPSFQPYSQIPQNYNVVTIVSPQPYNLQDAMNTVAVQPKREIPRNIKIISSIGICVCIFVVIMTIQSRLTKSN